MSVSRMRQQVGAAAFGRALCQSLGDLAVSLRLRLMLAHSAAQGFAFRGILRNGDLLGQTGRRLAAKSGHEGVMICPAVEANTALGHGTFPRSTWELPGIA